MTVLASNAPAYIGLSIGFAIVVAVAALVAVLLTYASRIAEQAGSALLALEQVRENTASLPAVDAVNSHAVAILQAARAARRALGG
jgi:cytoskeletal protein RodZ